MRKTFTTFVVATALTASAFAVSAQEQTTPETGEMMQNEGAMQGGMMDGDMMGMMKMMAEMKPMMEACTEMMASMTENMDGGMMPSEKSDGQICPNACRSTDRQAFIVRIQELTALTRRAALAILAATISSPAFANHPGENLDARMFEMEPYFQAIDAAQAPGFELQDSEGNPVRLSDFSDKVVILHFIYANCPDICPLHAEKIAAVQASINYGPMKELVQFISITTDPVNDTPDVLRDYSDRHGLDPSNWVILTKRPDQTENATRVLARDYGLEFTMTADSDMMMHGAVTHVVDIGGRFAAKFHGMDFKNVNLILYVSELTNNAQHRRREPSWWDRLTGVFQ